MLLIYILIIAGCRDKEWKCNNDKCIAPCYRHDGDNDCGDNSDEATFNGRLYLIQGGITDLSEYIYSYTGYSRLARPKRDIIIEVDSEGLKIRDRTTKNVLYNHMVGDITYVIILKSDGSYIRYLHKDSMNGYKDYVFNNLEGTKVLTGMKELFKGTSFTEVDGYYWNFHGYTVYQLN